MPPKIRIGVFFHREDIPKNGEGGVFGGVKHRGGLRH